MHLAPPSRSTAAEDCRPRRRSELRQVLECGSPLPLWILRPGGLLVSSAQSHKSNQWWGFRAWNFFSPSHISPMPNDTVLQLELPGLRKLKSGKVREIFDLGDR